MKMKKNSRKSKWLKILAMLGLSGLFFYTGHAMAATAMDLSGVATNITKTFPAVAKLIVAGAYVAGFGFAVAAILKFKAHKDNPTQVPVGTPIALLFIAVALIFMPSLFEVGGKTIFGSGMKPGSISGTYVVPGTN